MANLQNQFNEFHRTIRLKGYSENSTLRDKRDLLLRDLKAGLKKQVEDEGAPQLSFQNFDQGSYAIHTGTKPLHKSDDFDIDVGLVFDLNSTDHQEYLDDPVKLKKRIYNALNRENRTVQIKEPCVRVQYSKNGENAYHVDLAIYKSIEGTDELDLARGKENSSADNRDWDRQDPKGLISKVNNVQSDADNRAQMRRCIRYLKRWRDKKFTNGGAPVSIALTIAAYHWFVSSIDIDGKPSDQKALLNLVTTMLSQKGADNRLVITLPVTPNTDLLSMMTDNQMENFLSKIEQLKDAVQKSIDLLCPHEASKQLEKQFGDEFPIPEKEETAKKAALPVVTTGSSA